MDVIQSVIDFIGSMNMCDEISNEAYKKLTIYLDELLSALPEQFNPCTVCQEFDCTGCKFRRTNE